MTRSVTGRDGRGHVFDALCVKKVPQAFEKTGARYSIMRAIVTENQVAMTGT